MIDILFEFKNGLTITDEYFSEKMFLIQQEHPESQSMTNSGYEWSEIGMASLFAVLYEKEARYCPEHKSWYVYQDGRWQHDEGSILVSEKMKDFTRLMTLYCSDIEDDDTRKDYTKFISKLGDRRMRDRILKDATGELYISATEFDKNPYLINCINGTYDLRDFSFREHDYRDYITMCTSFKHTINRKVRCERWEKFIDEVTEGDKEKADFLQRALGYSLLGVTNEECMFILHGKTTRNGKSTLLNTIEYLLGDYSSVAPVGMICHGKYNSSPESASPMLAGLKGKRFITMAESNEYGKLDEEKIKQYTGGESISARMLYQSAISFKPQFTFWLSCNDLPAVTDKSLFASERLKIIEFNRHFTHEQQDTHLKEELCLERNLSGIFMWLVKGYKKYLEHGLDMCENMAKVVRKYEKDNDVVEQFLDERCEYLPEEKYNPYGLQEKKIYTNGKDLYNAFKIWAKSAGFEIMGIRKFYAEMERHTEWYDNCSRSNGRNFRSLRLKTMV